MLAQLLSQSRSQTREYAQEKGFGISTVDFAEIAEQFEDFVDPNTEYVASLSPGELAAYQTALNGYTDEDLEVLFAESQNGDVTFPDQAGCSGAAQDEALFFAGLFDEFGDELDNLEERMLADQRVVDAQREFATCLSDAGYLVADVDELESQFSERYSAITGDETSFDSSFSKDLADGEPWVQPFTPAAQKLVDELAAEEIAAAVVAWDCGIESREIQRQVGIKLEEEFLTANDASIDELVNG